MSRGTVRVLLVHRAARADVSLPKGKVDPGESLPETAVRETREEAGLAITLGAPLGTVEYDLPNGRGKVVHYWAAEVHDDAFAAIDFAPNDEIAAIEWVTIAKARAQLSYEHDIDVLDRFAERVRTGSARTFAIVVLRHAKAVDPSTWDGPDATRPLMFRGTHQAIASARGIAAFGPTKIFSSTAVRCLATVAPLAELTGLELRAKASISQDALEAGTSDVRRVVRRRLVRRVSTVLCTHGPVIPRILAELASAAAAAAAADQDADLRRAGMLDTGDYSIVHLSTDHAVPRIVAVETHSPI